MPDVVQPCVCCPIAMTACHAWHHPTVCSFQGRWWQAVPDVVIPYMISKDDDTMPRVIEYDVCVVKVPWWNSMLDFIRLYIKNKGNERMPRPTSSVRVCNTKENISCHVNVIRQFVLSNRQWCHLTPDYVWWQRELIELTCPTSSDRVGNHAQHRPTVYFLQGR